MIRHAVYPADIIFAQMTREWPKPPSPLPKGIKLSSDRLRLFKEKGAACVTCELEGVFFALESVGDETPHLNLYGVRANGRIVLMTKDHIVPKSKGGANHMANYQPMCEDCNGKKADTMPELAKA